MNMIEAIIEKVRSVLVDKVGINNIIVLFSEDIYRLRGQTLPMAVIVLDRTELENKYIKHYSVRCVDDKHEMENALYQNTAYFRVEITAQRSQVNDYYEKFIVNMHPYEQMMLNDDRVCFKFSDTIFTSRDSEVTNVMSVAISLDFTYLIKEKVEIDVIKATLEVEEPILK